MSDLVRERSALLKDFSGGLNNYWDASVIADNEVPFLQNMEFAPTGALTSRPPIWGQPGTQLPEANVHFDLLGFYIRDNGTRYGVYTSPTKTYVYDLNNTWTQIWDQKASDFVQHLGYIVMCRTSGAGAFWGPNGAQVWNGTAWVTSVNNTEPISTMPAARGIELHQQRLFVFGPLNTASQSIMYWSKIPGEVDGHPEQDWRYWDTTVDYVAVNNGDGQWITGLVAGYNEILIFRNDSTYRFVYSDLPEEGTIAKIAEGIGAENQNCIVRYENALIVLSGDQVHSYYNGIFQSLNDQKVRFQTTAGAASLPVPYALSILGPRLIVFFGGNIYVAQLKTGTWATWSTTTGFVYARVIPTPANNIERPAEAWAISNNAAGASGVRTVYRISDRVQSGDGSEAMTCALRTKIYDFNAPNEWKRLFWWAAEIMAVGTITARVFPVELLTQTQSTWDYLNTFTWDELTGVYGWDNPAPYGFNVETVATFTSTFPERLTLKLDHALRFRRVYFELYIDTTGVAATAPAQIFGITPMIGAKNSITERVS